MCDCNCRYPANVGDDPSFGGYDCDCAFSQDSNSQQQCCCHNENSACDCHRHDNCGCRRNKCCRCGLCGCLRGMFGCR